jgi:hypothetical protein
VDTADQSSRPLLECLLRATAVIIPAYFPGYDALIPVSVSGDRSQVQYVGIQFKNWAEDQRTTAQRQFDKMFRIQREIGSDARNVLSILVQLSGKEDEQIRTAKTGADGVIGSQLEGEHVTYTLIATSPCKRVLVYATAFPKGHKISSNLNLKIPSLEPLFVYTIGMEAFQSMTEYPSARKILFDALDFYSSPSNIGRHVRLNQDVYLLDQTLYQDRLQAAIRSSTYFHYGRRKQQTSKPFHPGPRSP